MGSRFSNTRVASRLRAFVPSCWRQPAVSAAALCLCLSVAGVAAQDPARAQTPIERAAERIRALQREADALASQEKTLLVDLRKLEVDRQIKVEEVSRADAELKETQAQLESTVARAAALSDAAEHARPDIEARLVQLYKMGRAGYWRLLLDVGDVRSMGRAYRTAAAMTRLDRERIQEHQRTLESLAKERAALETRAREAAALQEKTVAARVALDRAVAARTALVASIDARRDLNAQLTGELQAAQQKLQASVSQLGSPGAGRPAAAVSLPIRPFRGALPWPAGGVVISQFGAARGRGAARSGIEISIAEGRPVRAIHEGSVAFADQFTGYGNLVIVDHGEGAYSLYGHMESLDVKRGDHVDPQTRLGATGRNPSGNPALYFELRIDAKPVDPLQWLKK
jgi:septal ring factor EnvC (AmiA/AmiB activator)